MTLCAAWALLLCAGCGSVPTAVPSSAKTGVPTVAPPSLGFFSKIRAPDDREPVLKLGARGVQIFRCEKQNGKSTWAFRQPDAELVDDSGKPVGRHGVNFSFEHADGSRLVSTIAAYEDAARASDLRWLLMTTRSFGSGALEGVTHVQRINTAGGMPPVNCDPGQVGRLLRVDFTAEFIFYRPRAAT